MKSYGAVAVVVAFSGVTSVAQAQPASPSPKKATPAAATKGTAAAAVAPEAAPTAGSATTAPAAAPAAPAAPTTSSSGATAAPVTATATAPTSTLPAAAESGGAVDEHGVRRRSHPLPAGSDLYVVPQVVGVAPPAPEAPPAPPKLRYPFGLELNFMPVWLTNRGFDLFSSNDVAMRIGLSLDAELTEIATRTPLAIEIGWTTDSKQAKALFSQFDSEYSAQNLHGGLKLSHRVTSFLAPHVRVAGGASSVSTRFTATGGSNVKEFESQNWVAFGMLGAGATATVPTRAAVQPAFTVEGGYLVSGSTPLKLVPDTSASGTSALNTSGANLGTFGRSGPYLRVGLAIRY